MIEYQVVASFQVKSDPDFDPPHAIADDLRRELRLWAEAYGGPGGLDITINKIGAQGESSVIAGAGP